MFIGAVIPIFPKSGWVSLVLMIFVFLPLFYIGLGLFQYGELGFHLNIANIKIVLIKNRKVFLLSIILVVLIFFGWKYYNQSQIKVSCLKLAEYRRDAYLIKYEGDIRAFKTQDEAVNYCMKVLHP